AVRSHSGVMPGRLLGMSRIITKCGCRTGRARRAPHDQRRRRPSRLPRLDPEGHFRGWADELGGRMVGEAGPARFDGGWSAKLNGRYHKAALNAFMVVVLAHWAEHIAQVVQIWGFGWPRAKAKGLLGYAYPWLVTSEWMHYGYAVVMLVAL